eukprot:2032317-Rhodomonas_salina.1
MVVRAQATPVVATPVVATPVVAAPVVATPATCARCAGVLDWECVQAGCGHAYHMRCIDPTMTPVSTMPMCCKPWKLFPRLFPGGFKFMDSDE